MSKACVGCDGHRITTYYNPGTQSLRLDHSCRTKNKAFRRVVDMPRECKDRSERGAGERVSVEVRRAEDYMTGEEEVEEI